MITSARKNPIPDNMANTGSTWALVPWVRRGSVCGVFGSSPPIAAMVVVVVDDVVVGRRVVKTGVVDDDVVVAARVVLGVVDDVVFGTVVGTVVDWWTVVVLPLQPRSPQCVVRLGAAAAPADRPGPASAATRTATVTAPRANWINFAMLIRRATNTSVAHRGATGVAGAVPTARRPGR